MSLTVSIISQDESFDTTALEKEIPAPHNDLFGVENCRYSLWGHSVMKNLGCNQIYSLRETNVYAYDDDVIELKKELEKILDKIELVSKETGFEKDYIEFRVKNALETIKIVEKNIEKVGLALW